MRIFAALIAFAIAAVFSTSAAADIPPPRDYVEECTVEKAQKRTSGECQTCSAGFKDKEACNEKFKDTDFTKECQAYGGSFWDEVWCKAGEATPAKTQEKADEGKKAGGKPVASTEKQSCRVVSVPPAPALLVLLLFARRRR